jgi:hypothetical protein
MQQGIVLDLVLLLVNKIQDVNITVWPIFILLTELLMLLTP